jgi:hypothetical protein
MSHDPMGLLPGLLQGSFTFFYIIFICHYCPQVIEFSQISDYLVPVIFLLVINLGFSYMFTYLVNFPLIYVQVWIIIILKMMILLRQSPERNWSKQEGSYGSNEEIVDW